MHLQLLLLTILAPFAISTAILELRDAKNGDHTPLPADFLVDGALETPVSLRAISQQIEFGTRYLVCDITMPYQPNPVVVLVNGG